jgi:hypothetical protein
MIGMGSEGPGHSQQRSTMSLRLMDYLRLTALPDVS